MPKGSRLPFCVWCKRNRVKRGDALFCSGRCYSDSGHRADVGRVNGPKWSVRYWKKFDEIFYQKHGHLDRVDQTRLLIQIGMRRAYKGRRRFAGIGRRTRDDMPTGIIKG